MALRYECAMVGVGTRIVTRSIVFVCGCVGGSVQTPNSVLVVIAVVVLVVLAIVMAAVDCGFGGGGNTVRCTR